MSKVTKSHTPVELTLQDRERLQKLRDEAQDLARERAATIARVLKWPEPQPGSRVVVLSWPAGGPVFLTAEQQGALDDCANNGGSPIVSFEYDENDHLIGTHGGCDGPTMCQTLW